MYIFRNQSIVMVNRMLIFFSNNFVAAVDFKFSAIISVSLNPIFKSPKLKACFHKTKIILACFKACFFFQNLIILSYKFFYADRTLNVENMGGIYLRGFLIFWGDRQYRIRQGHLFSSLQKVSSLSYFQTKSITPEAILNIFFNFFMSGA